MSQKNANDAAKLRIRKESDFNITEFYRLSFVFLGDKSSGFIRNHYLCRKKIMNIESIREYCLSLPLVTEDFPFDETTLVFRIMGKIFACLDLERPEWVTMKCNADYALELREVHPEVEGAWHWNKKYWNQVNLYGGLEDDFIQGLLRHSYSEVVKKLKKQERMEHPEMMEVKE